MLARKVITQRSLDGDFSWCDDERAKSWFKEVQTDPQGTGTYYWFTVNWPSYQVLNTAKLLSMVEAVKDLYSDNQWFGPSGAFRFEFHTKEGGHYHCHILIQSVGKKAIDVKRHLKTTKTCHRLGVDTPNAIHFGGRGKKFTFRYEDKIRYINGDKVESKQEYVQADEELFRSLGVSQVHLMGVADPRTCRQPQLTQP
jgi:hypothetical protein